MEDERSFFEAGPFEAEEESGSRWPGGGRSQPSRPSRPPGLPRPPGRTPPRRPWRRGVGPVYFGSPAHEPNEPNRCEVLLVLEGYAPSGVKLEAHHEPMLHRLAAELRRMGGAASTVEVVALTPSSRAPGEGDFGDRRTEAVVQRLKALLKNDSRIAFRRLARKTAGPSRVEIRACLN